MLHIILTVLKIIGIFLLILLGTILFLLVAVLAAPITYNISGEWNQQLKLQGKIRWLYRIVGISLELQDGKPDIRISLFGRSLGEQKEPSQPKKTQPSSKQKQILKQEQISKPKEISEPEEVSKPKETSKPEKVSESEETSKPEKVSESEETSKAEEVSKPKEVSKPEKISESEQISAEPESSEQSAQMNDSAEKETVVEEIKPMEEEIKTAMETESEEAEPEENRIITIFRRLAAFLEQESVKKLIGKLWKSIRKIFSHLSPSVLFVKGRVGTDDPALTGRIMEAAAVLYAFYGEHIQLVSDFEEEVLEVEFTIKGRIIPGYLIMKILGMGLRILLNGECRALYKEIKQGLA